MRKFIAVFALASVLLLSNIPIASAVTVPTAPSILPGNSLAYNNVLETDDALFLAAYEIDWDTTIYTPLDAIVYLADFDNVPYICNGCTQHVAFLPAGIAAVYMTSAELTTAGITFNNSEVRLVVQSNPITFSNTLNTGSLGNVTWVSNASLAATKTDLISQIPDLVEQIQLSYPSDVLVQNDLVTATGANLLVSVFSPFLNLIPEIFSIGVADLFTGDFTPDTTTPLETQISVDHGSSPAFLGLSGLATGLGIDRATLGFLIIIGLGIPILVVAKKELKSMTMGFAVLSGLLVWWAGLGLIPMQVIFVLDIFMIAIIGIYFWRQVPTN